MGFWLWRARQAARRPRHDSPAELLALLERRAKRSGRLGEWEYFLEAPQVDPSMDQLRLKCLELDQRHSSPESHRLYTEAGQAQLESLIQVMKSVAQARHPE